MAQLLPLAAASAVPATAGAAALAKGAALAGTASTSLATGLTAGATLGGGISAMPALSYAGANLAGSGIMGALPSAIAPTAGIFANPAAAGFLGKSFAPLAAQTVSPLATAGTTAGLEAAKAGIIKNAMTQNAMQNAIMQNVAGGQAAQNLAGSALTSQLPGQAGNISNQMFNQLTQEFGRKGLGQGFQQVGSKLASTAPADISSAANLADDFMNVPHSTITQGPVGLRSASGLTSPEALSTQRAAAQNYYDVVGRQAQLTSDAARSQKLAIEAGLESPIIEGENFLTNFGNLLQNPSMDAAIDYAKKHPGPTAMAGYGLYKAMQPRYKAPEQDKGMIRPYEFAYNPNAEAYAVSPTTDSREQVYFNPVFIPREPVKAKEGGIMALAVGGPVETMSAMNSVGGNMMYPQAQLQTPLYANPVVQRPEPVNVISPSSGAAVGAYSGEQKFAKGGEPKTEGEYKYDFDPKTNTFTQLSAPRYADTKDKTLPPLYTGQKVSGGVAAPVGGPGIAALMPQAQQVYAGPVIPAYQTPEQQLGLTDFYAMMDRRLGAMGGYAAGGGISDLGNYSDGGRLLRGPGDGVSDSIPAVIGNKQPARLADGEFVIPARIVSELGNGSTEAGARKLYAMMDRVQKARGKTVGKKKVAVNTRADKHLPA